MTLSITYPRFKSFLPGGSAPNAGGTVECYLAGTNTPQIVYADGLFSVSLGSIVTLDANGEALMFPITNSPYKFLVKDSLGNLLSTTDQWSAGGSGGSGGASLAGGHNFLMNGGFEIAQVQPAIGAGGNLTGASPQFLNPDGWACRFQSGTPANYTSSRVASTLIGSQYALQMARAGGIATAVMSFVQNIETLDVVQMQGQQICLSFWFNATAQNFVSSASVFGGTGTDDNWQGLGSLVGQTTLIPSVTGVVSGSFSQFVGASSVVVPSTVFSMSVVIQVTFFGTSSGGGDLIQLDNCQLELGTAPTNFEREAADRLLSRCQRRYYKSMGQQYAVAQAVGNATGAFKWQQTVGAGIATSSPTFPQPMNMRSGPFSVLPTITTYNPANANAQVNNQTTTVDCTATTASVGEQAIGQANCNYTTAAGSAVGNTNAVHYTIDKRF